MAEEHPTQTSKYHTWKTWSDEELAKVLQEDLQPDVDMALLILRDRYQAKFEGYLANKQFSQDWIDNIIQQIWIGFYKQIKVKGVKRKVSSLLWAIAKRREIDAIRRLQVERKIESDIPIGWSDEEDGLSVEIIEESVEELLEKQYEEEFVRRIPFIDGVLADCQRVVWVLRYSLEYPTKLVTRLTGKQDSTVGMALLNGRRRVKKYMESEEFAVETAFGSQELPGLLTRTLPRKDSLVVERFSNAITPKLTPEELKPLGLTNQEFRENYVTSLLMPWEPYQWDEMGQPSLVLTKRTDWEKMQTDFQCLYQNPHQLEYLSPEECLLKIDRDSKNVILTVEQMLEFLPEPEDWAGTELSDNTFFAIHEPQISFPVTLGFFDSSLYTPELYKRWPFLPQEAGL